MFKTKKIVSLFTFAFLLMILAACSSDDADSGLAVQGSEDKVYTLRSSSMAPPNGLFGLGYVAFLDEIEKRSEGRIKFERYDSMSLIKGGDELDSLGAKIADIAIFIPSYVPGKLPLATVGTNPGLWEDSWVGAKAFNELYNTVPEMNQEIESHNVKFVGQYALSTLYVLSKKEIKSVKDIKGMNVAANGQNGLLAKALGANVTSVPVEELYDAFTRGVVDATFYGPVEALTYGLTETVNYVYKLPVGNSAGLIGMNMDYWESLPEDLQNIILEVGSEYLPKAFHEIYQSEGVAEALAELEKNGAVFIEPSEADLEKVRAISVDEVYPTWSNSLNDPELGAQVLDKFRELIGKYEAENPYSE